MRPVVGIYVPPGGDAAAAFAIVEGTEYKTWPILSEDDSVRDFITHVHAPDCPAIEEKYLAAGRSRFQHNVGRHQIPIGDEPTTRRRR
ncbi:MAG: hypothetical protein Q8N51_00865 [Gammaproteobacteria bacterium]|nr:hypothetical protein [Gammaproteobacteria bacterium]